MTANDFRKLALSLPETCEDEHMDHPDFRVANKIFATISPDEECGMVKLTPQQQRQFILMDGDAFFPVKGAWGKRGCTYVRLAKATRDVVRPALVAAWQNTAPKRLVEEHDPEAQG